MAALADPTNPLWPFPFTPQDWAQTPLAVQAYVHTLRDEVKQLHDGVEYWRLDFGRSLRLPPGHRDLLTLLIWEDYGLT